MHEAPSSPSSSLPRFGALLRAAWSGFRARFWHLSALVALFSVISLAVQVSVFGAVAWESFLEYITAGGTASVGVVPLSGAPTGASLWIVVPVAVLILLLQLWFLSALVSLTVSGREAVVPSFRALLRRGWRALLSVFTIAAALFLSVRLMYFIMVLLTNLVHRYIGLSGGTVEMANRLFLLIFALAIVAGGIVAGLALFPAVSGGARNAFPLLREAGRRFLVSPWAIGWRVGVMLLILYGIDQLVSQLNLTGIPVNPQALLSLFYLPFMLFFLHECFRNSPPAKISS